MKIKAIMRIYMPKAHARTFVACLKICESWFFATSIANGSLMKDPVGVRTTADGSVKCFGIILVFSGILPDV